MLDSISFLFKNKYLHLEYSFIKNLIIMKPYIANLLNAAVLIGMGLWGYFSNEPADRSMTALIAPAFGVIFLLCTPLLKKENKAVAHIVVLLTLLIIIALIKPLTSNLSANDTMGIVRVGAMIVTSVIAMATFIKSFIDAKKASQS
jgi:hypothetical protein